MAPTDEAIVVKLMLLIEQVPDLGRKRLLSRLNSENGWHVSSKDFRAYISIIEEGKRRAIENLRQEAIQDENVTNGDAMLAKLMNASTLAPLTEGGSTSSEGSIGLRQSQDWAISAENAFDTPPSLPTDAWAAQVKYYEESTRQFILYGRGKYNYGITPNSDMQLKINICNNRIKDLWAKVGSKAAAREQLESRGCWPVQDIFEFYRAGARKAGLDINDIIRQFEAEYDVNPIKGREPDSPQQVARQALRAKTFKKEKLKVLRIAAQSGYGVVEVDARGAPIWNEQKHGEFVVIATRIDKHTGLEVGDVR